jgi:branched-subunit amino acid transport protein
MGSTGWWVLIAALAGLTFVIKAVGPVLFGGRALPPRSAALIAVLPAALLAALVVTTTLTQEQRFAVDASAAGVAVAGVLIWRRAPLLLAVVVAMAVTAGVRALG